ncbi:hypothetical protein F511_13264 [Dorcoceras hygrometricum]|uniref:Uncharacterized protein n=1 Tax=Dorcoceras hygrometricum TaxID=472368 RepID=A0A2Z7A3F6_9LAMI|nr:hypothetical protein F511_13264 [Dorcoceras hygrometricum]
MKKLYRRGTVHPTPPVVSDQLLSFLPAAILTLAAALSQEEREVLAYVISCSSANFSNSHHKKTPTAGGSKGVATDHPVCFSCYCFRCYMNYWVKWDSSPNRQVIHEIIDAFEESLFKESRKEKNKRERRKGKSVKGKTSLELDESNKSEPSLSKQDFNFTESNSAADHGIDGDGDVGENSGRVEEENVEEEELEKGSVRRFVSFLGERIWSVWG